MPGVPADVMIFVMSVRVMSRTVMRSSRRWSRECDDCQRTHRQRQNTKRPAKRNQLNHSYVLCNTPRSHDPDRTVVQPRKTNCDVAR